MYLSEEHADLLGRCSEDRLPSRYFHYQDPFRRSNGYRGRCLIEHDTIVADVPSGQALPERVIVVDFAAGLVASCGSGGGA